MNSLNYIGGKKAECQERRDKMTNQTCQSSDTSGRGWGTGKFATDVARYQSKDKVRQE